MSSITGVKRDERGGGLKIEIFEFLFNLDQILHRKFKGWKSEMVRTA